MHTRKAKKKTKQLKQVHECHHRIRVRSIYAYVMNEKAENPFTYDKFSEANRKILHGRRGVVYLLCVLVHLYAFQKLKSPRNITSLMFALCEQTLPSIQIENKKTG